MASGHDAYGLLHTHEFLLVQQSTGDLESRTAVLHLVSHGPVEYKSLKALKVWICRGRTWTFKWQFSLFNCFFQYKIGRVDVHDESTKSNGHVAAKETAARHQRKHIHAEHENTETGESSKAGKLSILREDNNM